MERELIECVHSVEDVVSKREICKTIIALGRVGGYLLKSLTVL
jgi:hypothetical protein